MPPRVSAVARLGLLLLCALGLVQDARAQTTQCVTTASGDVPATTTVTVTAWDANMQAYTLTTGQTLVFSPQQPPTLDVSRGFTAVVLARPDAASQTADLVTLKNTNTNTIAKLGAASGTVVAVCPNSAATTITVTGTKLDAQTALATADRGLGVYALVASDAAAKVYAPDANGNFLHAGVGVSGCSGFGTASALAAGYSLTLGGSAFAGLLGEAFVAPRALSRNELGLVIHGLAAYAGVEPTGEFDRWYSFDGDLASYHDRADRRRAAAQHEAEAVVGGGVADIVYDFGLQSIDTVAKFTTYAKTIPGIDRTFVDELEFQNTGTGGYGICSVDGGNHNAGGIKFPLPNTHSIVTVRYRESYLKSQTALTLKIGPSGALTTRTGTYDASTGNIEYTTSYSEGDEFLLEDGVGAHACIGNNLRIQISASDPAAASDSATLTSGGSAVPESAWVFTPAPDRRLYALDVAAAQTLDAPVDPAFAWYDPSGVSDAWTVAAWLKLASGATNVLTLADGAAATVPATDACMLVDSATVNFARSCASTPPTACTATSADTLSGSFPASKVTDGVIDDDINLNFWHAGSSVTNVLKIDLGQTRAIHTIKIHFRNNDLFQDRNADFTLWVGDNTAYSSNTNCFTFYGIPEIWYADGYPCCASGRYFFLACGPACAVSEIYIYGRNDGTPAWTHVALTHAAGAATADLHVNGAATGTTVTVSTLTTRGSVRVAGAAVDDLRVYQHDYAAGVQQAGAPEPAAGGGAR